MQLKSTLTFLKQLRRTTIFLRLSPAPPHLPMCATAPMIFFAESAATPTLSLALTNTSPFPISATTPTHLFREERAQRRDHDFTFPFLISVTAPSLCLSSRNSPLSLFSVTTLATSYFLSLANTPPPINTTLSPHHHPKFSPPFSFLTQHQPLIHNHLQPPRPTTTATNLTSGNHRNHHLPLSWPHLSLSLGFPSLFSFSSFSLLLGFGRETEGEEDERRGGRRETAR